MNTQQQNALVNLNEMDLRTNANDPNCCNDLKVAAKVFETEFPSLSQQEIEYVIHQTLVQCRRKSTFEHEIRVKYAGKLKRLVNTALQRFQSESPQFALIPIHSAFGDYKPDSKLVKIISTDIYPELNEDYFEKNLINKFLVIPNFHRLGVDKFADWHKLSLTCFKGLIRIFAINMNHSGFKQVIFENLHEAGLGTRNNNSFIVTSREVLPCFDFSCKLSGIPFLVDEIEDHNFSQIIESLTSQEFSKGTIGLRAAIALMHFNEAIESSNKLTKVISLCSAIETMCGAFINTEECVTCKSIKFSEKLYEFLDNIVFKGYGTKILNDEAAKKTFKAIYSLRSKIVHGSIDSNQLSNLDDQFKQALKFVSKTLFVLLARLCTTGFEKKVKNKR
ncbi:MULTISPECIES: HEPN domain-containing protein [Pseudoalteromonas]|uniref:HEPN domain-containing protein n=1 Tax=Pseudoalteromonas TaxID=53246 RepID=UPI00272982D9|nr:HEPN domain-containing protein [Pseudoalteromonas sp.]